MGTYARRRIVAAILAATMVIGTSAMEALAQEFAGSTVTTDGGASNEVGDALVLAPDVTINDGDVSNETGIGVVISGGISAGASPGGGSDASVVE